MSVRVSINLRKTKKNCHNGRYADRDFKSKPLE